MTRIAVAALTLAALLAFAPTASAIYIVTPLHLRVSDDRVEVGDQVQLVISPAPDWDGDTYAGRTLVLRYHYDPNEKPASHSDENGSSSDEPVSSGDVMSDTGPHVPEQREIGRVTLDDKSSATFTWTIPSELQDHNAFLSVANATDSEDSLAFANVGVGDAPPVMAILAAESGPAPDEIADGSEQVDDTPPPSTAADDASARSDVPAPGVLAIVVGLGAAAILVARRR